MFVKSSKVEDPTSFRLITIVPREKGSPLYLNISQASFKNAKYYCLSYTWEPSGPAHQVWMNGEPRMIGHNLWLFLESARLAGLDLPIWIDAISIDQNNLEERNRSVSRMGDIYSNADRVFLWLGQLKRGLQAFLVSLQRLEEELTRYAQRRDRRAAIFARLESMNAHARATWERHAVEILSLPYFERLWIAQEILLSDAAHIWLDEGPSLDMDLLSEIMIAILSHKRQDVLTQMSAMPGYKYIWWHYTTSQESRVIQGPIDLASLVPRFAESKCQLSNDRVYALLSLATNGDKFEVDYSIDTTTLFTRTMQFSMDGRPLDSLLLVGANLLELLNLLPTEPPQDHDPIQVSRTAAHVSPPTFRSSRLHLSPTTTYSTSTALVQISLPPHTTHLFEYAFAPGTSSTPSKITHCRIHEHLIIPQLSAPAPIVTNKTPPSSPAPQLPSSQPAILHDKAYYIHIPIPSESLHYFTLSPSAPLLHSWTSPPLTFSSPSSPSPLATSSSKTLILHSPSHSNISPTTQNPPALPPPHLSPSTHSLPLTVVWDAYFQHDTARIFGAVADAVGQEIWDQLRVSEVRSDALAGRDGCVRVGPVLLEGKRGVVGAKRVVSGGDGGERLKRKGVMGGEKRWGASIRVTWEMMRVKRIVCVRRDRVSRGI